MKTSCISHPASQPLIIIREWQKDFCKENECQANHNCVAALLTFFEYWHNIKTAQAIKGKQVNDISEKHGDDRSQDESLWQFHTTAEIIDGIMGMFQRDCVAAGVAFLETVGVLETGKNPNPKYAFDKTRWFLFKPEIINDWLGSSKSNNRLRKSNNRLRKSNNRIPSPKNRKSSFISSEISSKTSLESIPAPPSRKFENKKNSKGKKVSRDNRGHKNGNSKTDLIEQQNSPPPQFRDTPPPQDRKKFEQVFCEMNNAYYFLKDQDGKRLHPFSIEKVHPRFKAELWNWYEDVSIENLKEAWNWFLQNRAFKFNGNHSPRVFVKNLPQILLYVQKGRKPSELFAEKKNGKYQTGSERVFAA